jgi:GAF domain-containing protein
MTISPRSAPALAAPGGDVLDTLSPRDAEAVRLLMEVGERRRVELHLLQQIAAALSRTLDEDTILDEVARGTLRSLGGSGVIVVVADEATGLLMTRRHVSVEGDQPLIPLSAEGGALAAAQLTGEPRLLTRERADAVEAIDLTMGKGSGVEALLVVPMMHGRKMLGAILAYAADRHAYDADTREFLTTLAINAGSSLRNAHLYATSERERRQSDAMAEVARAAGESLKATEVQRLIMRHAVALLKADGACVAVRDGDYLNVESAIGVADVMAGVVVPVSGSISGHVVQSGIACIINDVQGDPRAHRRNLTLVPVRRAVIVPLRTPRGTIGVLAVYNREDEFRDDDARILQRLADQVAVTIVNARLFADIQEATREWSSTFDAIGVGMVVVNDEGRVLRCNTRARQLAGEESPMGPVGRSFYQAILGGEPGDPDPLRSAMVDGVRQRAVCVSADGTRRFEIAASPHQDGGAVVTFDLAQE